MDTSHGRKEAVWRRKLYKTRPKTWRKTKDLIQTSIPPILLNTGISIQQQLTSLASIPPILLNAGISIPYFSSSRRMLLISSSTTHSYTFSHTHTHSRDVRKPNFGSVFKNLNRTEAKRSNPKFRFPWLFSNELVSYK